MSNDGRQKTWHDMFISTYIETTTASLPFLLFYPLDIIFIWGIAC
jgi:hypothetical protein